MDFAAQKKSKVLSKVFSENSQLAIKKSPVPIGGEVKFYFLTTFTTHFTLLDTTFVTRHKQSRCAFNFDILFPSTD